MRPTVGYLLDTNVIVHLIRGNALGVRIDQRYGLRSAMQNSMISVVTVGEMFSLVRQLDWGDKKQATLQTLLDEIVWVDIDHPDILNAYGAIDHVSRSQGRKMGKNDAWIAATAMVTKATLLTTDKDFDHLQGTHLDREWIDPTETLAD